jgi:hypothetical protein
MLKSVPVLKFDVSVGSISEHLKKRVFEDPNMAVKPI